MLPGPPTPEKRAVRGSNATGGSPPAANHRDAEQQSAGQRSLDGARPAAGPQDAERVGWALRVLSSEPPSAPSTSIDKVGGQVEACTLEAHPWSVFSVVVIRSVRLSRLVAWGVGAGLSRHLDDHVDELVVDRRTLAGQVGPHLLAEVGEAGGLVGLDVPAGGRSVVARHRHGALLVWVVVRAVSTG